jgi:hypothetical protein
VILSIVPLAYEFPITGGRLELHVRGTIGNDCLVAWH